MSLNFTPEFYIYLICSVICYLIFIILIYTALKKNKKVLFLLSISILCFALNLFNNSIALLLMNELIFISGAYVLYGSVFFLLFFIDYTLQERITAIKLAAISIIGTLLVISSIQGDVVILFYDYGFPSLKRSGYFSIIFYLLIFIFVISINYWIIKTSINSPKELEKYSKRLIYASVLCLIGAIFLFLQEIIIIPISIFFTFLGMIVIIITIIKEPKILFILPFKTYRLIVIYKDSGVDIFSHIWESSNISDDLLAGLMSIMNKMGTELINQGELQHVAYKKGVFLMKGTEHLIFGLIVNKTSKFLNKCLNEFSIDFQNKYQHILKNWVGDLSPFIDAPSLLEKHFGYIPSRIQK
ncbi:MAG: hypothetical protein KGD63_00800 [Candidatus Lokiarchaeota archaeon]|nr:hypothetical protein [Candidatus Lokiarchaeota archaeon]